MSTHTPLSAPSWTTWTHLTNSLPALILLALGIILIAAACWLLLRRRRSSHATSPHATSHSISAQTAHDQDTTHLWRHALATKYAQDTAAFLAAQTMWQIARDTAARHGRGQHP